MLRRLLLAAAATAIVPLAATLAPSAANAATSAATCTSGVAVTQFAFNPPSVPLGSSSALTLVLQNCTSQAITGSTDWFGTYGGSVCPVLDAVPFSYSIAPGGTYTLTNRFGDPGFSGCQPTSLRMSANVNVNGVSGTVTTVSATLQFISCTSGIAVNQFSFSPAAVPPGQLSTATLVLQNCTSQTITGGVIWGAAFTGSGTGIPAGCPVIDPLGSGYTIAAGGTTTLTMQFGDTFAGCPATGLTATANLSVTGVTGTVAAPSAKLVIQQPTSPPPPPPVGCHVTYTPSNWSGGFTANVVISNTGPAAINGWALTFAFGGDQKVTSAWNATVSQSGPNVSATNVSYNASIPAGGSQSFGFQGTWTSSDAAPPSFSVNGAACN